MTAISYRNYSFKSNTLKYQTAGRSKAKNRSAKISNSSGVSAAPGSSSLPGSLAKLNTSAALNSLAEINNSGILTKIANSAKASESPLEPWSSFSTQPAGSASETQWLGYTVENDEHTFGDTWEKVDALPGFYELKEGRPIGWVGMHPEMEFRFYHAAESTDENPVVVARGVDERGRLFEQKINLNQIDPYNATKVEMSALTHVYKREDPFMTIPFLDYCNDEDVLNTRFDYIGSFQAAIQTSRRLGFIREANDYEENINYLLKVTKNHTTSGMSAGSSNTVDADKNLELCINAARERFLSGMIRKYSSEELSDQLLDSALFG